MTHAKHEKLTCSSTIPALLVIEGDGLTHPDRCFLIEAFSDGHIWLDYPRIEFADAVTGYLVIPGEAKLWFRAHCLGGRRSHRTCLAVDASSSRMMHRIGEYLFTHAGHSVRALRDAGFPLRTVRGNISITIATDAAEIDEVQRFRTRCYRRAGKLRRSAAMRDAIDTNGHSEIFVARHFSQLVATSRFTTPLTQEHFELAQFLSWPEDFPPPDDIVEITRLCTHPDYRGMDLLAQLFRRMAIRCWETKRTYLCVSAEAKLGRLYTHIGFTETRYRYRHPLLANTDHIVYLGKFLDGMSGRTVSLLAWTLLWRDVVDFLRANNGLTFDLAGEIRYAIMHTASIPLAIALRA